ncbi:DoxX-like family protein [Leptospira sp. WS92.C1]
MKKETIYSVSQKLSLLCQKDQAARTGPSFATGSYKILKYGIIAVWIANGLFCKILDWVPRHQQIVARILGDEVAPIFTKVIGFSEVMMAIWILTGMKSRWNAVAQILIVGLMNVLEFILVPDLLLWGRANSIFASLFMILVGYHEFVLNPNRVSSN